MFMRRLLAWLQRAAQSLVSNGTQDRRLRQKAFVSRWPRPSAPDVRDAWHLVVGGLGHQGSPVGHIRSLIDMLERRKSGAWDEFGLDFEAAGDSTEVEVYFVGDTARCRVDALLKELVALRAELERHFS